MHAVMWKIEAMDLKYSSKGCMGGLDREKRKREM